MNVGQLRHLVTPQRSTFTDNDLGEPVDSWADIVPELWARVEPTSGKEKYSALQVQAEVDHRILCRYQAALDTLAPDDRIVWGSKVFDIKSVINTEGRNIQIEIFAKQHI